MLKIFELSFRCYGKVTVFDLLSYLTLRTLNECQKDTQKKANITLALRGFQVCGKRGKMLSGMC